MALLPTTWRILSTFGSFVNKELLTMTGPFGRVPTQSLRFGQQKNLDLTRTH